VDGWTTRICPLPIPTQLNATENAMPPRAAGATGKRVAKAAAISAPPRPKRLAAAAAPRSYAEADEGEDVVVTPSDVAEVAAAARSSAPAAPSGSRSVAGHDGSRDAWGRLSAFKDAPSHFRPNLTPRQMLEQGMHGGIYFNPKGGKPGILYPRHTHPDGIPGVGIDEFPPAWFEGVPSRLYSSRCYSVANNRYRVKSGLDQEGWERSGWICPVDPRGWTQWYFRFFLGRRLEGDEGESYATTERDARR